MNKENTSGGDVNSQRIRPAQILSAVSYLNQCRSQERLFAILTGESRHDLDLVLRRFSSELPPSSRVARILAPTDSSHAFLEAILAQFGFEPFESTSDDLHRLLNVVLRQVSAQQGTAVILIEDAQDFGPRVFETIRELARNSRDITPVPLIVLTGHAALNRVLDSQGMATVAQYTRVRFDMETHAGDELPEIEALEAPALGPSFTLSLGDEFVRTIAVDRERMLIGRSHYCDIPIASRYVSRQHALLLRNPDGDWLIDLKSTNGTSVNSTLREQHRLEDGDVIAIGNHQLHYRNPVARPEVSATKPSRDQLSETMVMRSLQALRAVPDEHPEAADSTPSAA